MLKRQRKMLNKKATIGTTIVWMASTLVIAFLCLIVISLVVFLAGRSSTDYKDERIFPERAEMLFSILSKKTDIKFDEKLIADYHGQKRFVLKNLPKDDGGLWMLALLEKDQLKIEKEAFLKMKKTIAFPLHSNKGINAVLYLDEFGWGYTPGDQ